MKKYLRKLIAKILNFFENHSRQSRYEFLMDTGFLEIGAYSYGQPIIHSYKGSEAKVFIGKFTSISPEVIFITGGIHPTNWISTYPFRVKRAMEGAYMDGMPSTKGDINVGSDVWIGTGATILSGVEIGNGAIIAAGAVVTNNIPPYAIVAGVPAKVVGFRFEQEIIQQLLEIAWWNWNDEKIQKAVALLSSPNIKEFLATYSKTGK